MGSGHGWRRLCRGLLRAYPKVRGPFDDKCMMGRQSGPQTHSPATMKIIASLVHILLWLAFTTGAAWAARTAPLVEKGVVFEYKTPRTAEQVRGYILHAAGSFNSELTYKVESDSPGALQLEFNKGNSHYVSVLFTYGCDGFQTKYLTSKDLNYSESNGTRVIHPNYMVWIDQVIKQAKSAHAMQLNAKGEVTNPEVVAQISFISTGLTDTIKFSKSDETNACGKGDLVSEVASWSEAEVEARELEKKEWNAKYKTIVVFGRRIEPPSLPARTATINVAAFRPVQIIGSSYAYDYGKNVTAGRFRDGTQTCGPLALKFTPQGAKKYLIEFSVSNRILLSSQCKQTIFDVTDPEKRVPVPLEEGTACTP